MAEPTTSDLFPVDTNCVNCGEKFVYKNKQYNRRGLGTNIPKSTINIYEAIKTEWPTLAFSPETVNAKFICTSCVSKLNSINNSTVKLKKTRESFRALGKDHLWVHAEIATPSPKAPSSKRRRVAESSVESSCLQPCASNCKQEKKSKRRKETEQIKEALKVIIKTSEGDLRKAITTLQSALRLKGEEGIQQVSDVTMATVAEPSSMTSSTNQQLKSSGVLNINTEEKGLSDEEKTLYLKKIHSCTSPGCFRAFSSQFNLRRHLKSAHKVDTPTTATAKTKCLHPSCARQFVHVSKMLTHLESDHGVEIQRENLQFKSLDEFYKWKENEQTTNFVYFSKYQGAGFPKDNNHVVLYFKCQRDGSQRSHRAVGQGPKTNKVRGTVKMGMVCPARMFVKVNKVDGSISVEYIQSHSHPITAEDCKRQPMPQSLRSDIESKLARGMTEDEVMTELTGGAYLPTGKQGNRSGKVRKGDRSSINYGIPVENGVYFINKKRLSMMKKRLKLFTEISGEPPAKKKKTSDDIELEVAALRGQLSQLSDELDDTTVRETMLPEIHSLVTYLLNTCADAKKAQTVEDDTLEANVQETVVASDNHGKAVSTVQSTPSVPVFEQSANQTIAEEPTFFFSDGKNIIKVAIKRRGKPLDGNPTSSSVSAPLLSQVAQSNNNTGVPSLSQVVALSDNVTAPKLSQVAGSNDSITEHSLSKLEGPNENLTITAPTISKVTILNTSPNVSAPSIMAQVATPSTQIVPVSISKIVGEESTQNTMEIAPSQTVYATSETVTELLKPSSDTEQLPKDLEIDSNEAENPSDQMEVVRVIEQPPILYNLPSEGAYVTVCDVETEGGTVESGELSQDNQGSASILLNAIIAANLNGTDQNAS